MGYFWVWIHLVMVKTIRINMIYAKKYTAEEVIRLSGKQNIQAKMRDDAEDLRPLWKNCHFKTLSFLLTPTPRLLVHRDGTKLKKKKR